MRCAAADRPTSLVAAPTWTASAACLGSADLAPAAPCSGADLQHRPDTLMARITRAVGRRNVAYGIGTLALFVLGLLDGSLHGYGAFGAMVVWVAASLVFLGVNVMLILGWAIDQARGGVPMVASPVLRALLACALSLAAPALVVALVA